MTPTEAQTKERLEAEGWKVYHSGFPDFFCFKDCQVMFVEVKKGGQQLTTEQGKVGVVVGYDGEEKTIIDIEGKQHYLKNIRLSREDPVK
jgi:hypothetical protein